MDVSSGHRGPAKPTPETPSSGAVIGAGALHRETPPLRNATYRSFRQVSGLEISRLGSPPSFVLIDYERIDILSRTLEFSSRLSKAPPCLGM